MAIFRLRKKKIIEDDRPSFADISVSVASDKTSNHDHQKETKKRRRPLQLGTLRYVNCNCRTQSCRLDRVLDVAQETGKPIFAHFAAPPLPANGDTSGPCESEKVARIFSDRCLNREIEECFVPAVFNTDDFNDPDHCRKMGALFGLNINHRTSEHYLRIYTSDGKRVLVETNDISDKKTVQRLMMEALEDLHRHVPKSLYTTVCGIKACQGG